MQPNAGDPQTRSQTSTLSAQGWINDTLTKKTLYAHIMHIHKETRAHRHTTYITHKYVHRYLDEFLFRNVCYKHHLINPQITSLKQVCRIPPILCLVKLTNTIGAPLTIKRNWAGSWVTIR